MVKSWPFQGLSDLQLGDEKVTAWITWRVCFSWTSPSGLFLVTPKLPSTLWGPLGSAGWDEPQVFHPKKSAKVFGFLGFFFIVPPLQNKSMPKRKKPFFLGWRVFCERYSVENVLFGSCGLESKSIAKHSSTLFRTYELWGMIGRIVLLPSGLFRGVLEVR